MGDDERPRHDAVDRTLTDLPGEVAGHQLRARGGNPGVPAGELRVGVRVDDVANRPGTGQPTDGRQEWLGQGFGHRVHDQHALGSDLHQRVHPAAADQRHLPAHWQGLHLRGLRAEQRHEPGDGQQHRGRSQAQRRQQSALDLHHRRILCPCRPRRKHAGGRSCQATSRASSMPSRPGTPWSRGDYGAGTIAMRSPRNEPTQS